MTIGTSTGNRTTATALQTAAASACHFHLLPCFVAGTRIATPAGHRQIETLHPGDLVLTRHDGPQPLCRTLRQQMPATGPLAPIRIAAHTFGDHGTLFVAPHHRILICDPLAELLFGGPEVLVAAHDLVNDHSIRICEGGRVDYVHILFDRPQVIWAEGVLTECFHPATIAGSGTPAKTAGTTGAPPGPALTSNPGTARPALRTLRRAEAQVLLATGLAA